MLHRSKNVGNEKVFKKIEQKLEKRVNNGWDSKDVGVYANNIGHLKTWVNVALKNALKERKKLEKFD